MERIVTPKKMTDITNWHGVLLDKKVLKLLRPGLIVRVLCDYAEDKGIRKPWHSFGKLRGSSNYYRITKIKDGTLWGTCLDYYKVHPEECDEKGCRTGDTLAFRFENISEIPLDWYPKRIRNKMAGYRNTQNKGYAITGWRE
jgi:hypothetical protein